MQKSITNKKPKLTIVGRGAFGALIARHLRPHFTISFISRTDTDTEIAKKLLNTYAVVYSVPMVGLESSIARTKPHIAQNTVIIDVTSVKVKPLQLLSKHFKNNQILGTHPIFGPQSVKKNKGITNLPLVLCNVSCNTSTYNKIKRFCKTTLGCKIIEQTPTQHDTQMAHVQGLAHFIGRALKHIDIDSYATNTQSYEHLLELRDLLSGDSWELFETIQNTNPQAKQVRKKLLSELQSIDKRLQ